MFVALSTDLWGWDFESALDSWRVCSRLAPGMSEPESKATIQPEPGAQSGNRFGAVLTRPGWFCLLLVIVTFAVFWPVKNCDFVNYDDPMYVTSNHHVRQGLTLKGVAWAFTSGQTANWHPLTWLSLMLDVTLFG